MIIDSHCHLSSPQLGEYKKETKQYLLEAKKSRVELILDIATNTDMFKPCLDFATEINSNANEPLYPKVYCALGVHPLYIENNPNFTEKDFDLYLQNENLIAIGETGFDNYHSTGNSLVQREYFNIHANVACTNKLPIVIHTRNAATETLDALNYYVKNYNLTGVIHCFTGDISLARKFLDLGFYLSFSGVLTYKNTVDIQEVAAFAPLDKILTETDAPYLVPAVLRNKDYKVNNPEYVKYTFECLLSLRKENNDIVEKAIQNNFFSLFSKAT